MSAPASTNSMYKSTQKTFDMLAATPIHAVLSGAMLTCILIMDMYQLIFMVLGAGFFYVLQKMQPDMKKTKKILAVPPRQRVAGAGGCPPPSRGGNVTPALHQRGAGAADDKFAFLRPGGRAAQVELTRVLPGRAAGTPTEASRRDAGRMLSNTRFMPVLAPTFVSTGWEDEVKELLEQIQPTAESNLAVDKLVNSVGMVLSRVLPSVEVVGFANGDLNRGKAFGVAVPDVDIVVNVNINLLIRYLQGRSTSSRQQMGNQDTLRLYKAAIRAFTEQLVWGGGFKFRRSAFRGLAPKVTLLSPSVDDFQPGIPVDVYINTYTPLFHASFLVDAGGFDRRARELLFLVRRWTKDRGTCHAAKGHLSPYMWNLLAIYFLQVGLDAADGGAVLPAIANFPVTAGVAKGCINASVLAEKAAAANGIRAEAETQTQAQTTAMLFKQFVRFYCLQFDYTKEVISVRLGRRTAPDPKLHSIDVDGAQQQSEVAPIIEDPVNPTRNLGACMVPDSLKRYHAELARALSLLGDDDVPEAGSLAELLSPWVPPEQEGKGEDEEDEKDEKMAV